MFANQLWQHVPMRRREWLARPLGWAFATPENHSVHHSTRRSQTDSNYGVLLIIWDRLFGTYTDPFAAGEVRYGLGPVEDARAANLLSQLCLPFMRAGGAR